MAYTPEYINEYIGNRVRMRRRVIGMTQESLAQACGIEHQQISQYELGRNAISGARLWQIAQALGTSIDYFYEGLRSEQSTAVLEERPSFH